MNQLRTAAVYTLVLYALGVGAGIVFGLLRRLVGLEKQWGVFSTATAIQLTITLAITLGVFLALAKRHAARYYTTGSVVVLLSTTLGVVSAYFVAPQAARANYSWVVAILAPLAMHVAALAIAGRVGRTAQSSSNTSLERTREG